MDTNSETTSVKSAGTVTSLKTPGVKKQVGFQNRPRLIIPPPQGYKTPQLSTGTARISEFSGPNSAYKRRQSVFDFVTKSGLGAGERCAYCVYKKIKSWSRKWFTHMFLTVVLVLYTIGGAFIFESIEAAGESAAALEDIRISRNKLIEGLRTLSLQMPHNSSDPQWTTEAEERFNDYEATFRSWYTTDQFLKKHPDGIKWTYWNALVYCGTVYTSIGYGHIYPQTKAGKALTIVYAIIGLPIFLLALTDFGKLFTRCIKFFWSFVRRVYYTGNCRQARKTAHVKEIFKGAQLVYEIATFRRPSMFVDPENPESPSVETPATPALSNFEIDDEFNLPISLAIFILIIYILLGALIYCIWEDWPFFDSFYFVFISMSTVGFGDMVPDDPACMIVSIVYLVFGLALMTMCINVVQEKLSDTFQKASSKLGATMGITVADDGSITTIPPDNIEIPEVHVGNYLSVS